MRIYACICAHAPRDRRIRIQPYMYIYRYTGARPHWRAHTYTPIFADMSVNGRAHPRTDVYIYTPICIYAGIQAHAPIGVRIRIYPYMYICRYTGARAQGQTYTYTRPCVYMPVYGRTRPLAYVYGDTYICIYAGIRGHAPISVRIRIHRYMHICQYTGARAPLAYACGFPYACICTCIRTPVDPVPPMLQLPPRIYKPLDTQPYTPISLYTRKGLHTLSFASTPTVYIFFWAPNATVEPPAGTRHLHTHPNA